MNIRYSTLFFILCLCIKQTFAIPSLCVRPNSDTLVFVKAFDFSTLKDKEIQQRIILDIDGTHVYLLEHVWKSLIVHKLNTESGVITRSKVLKVDWNLGFNQIYSFGDAAKNLLWLRDNRKQQYFKIDLAAGKVTSQELRTVTNPIHNKLERRYLNYPESSDTTFSSSYHIGLKGGYKLVVVDDAWGQPWWPCLFVVSATTQTTSVSEQAECKLLWSFIYSGNYGHGFQSGEALLQASIQIGDKEKSKIFLTMLIQQALHWNDNTRLATYLQKYKEIIGAFDRQMFDAMSTFFLKHGLIAELEKNQTEWLAYELNYLKSIRKSELDFFDQANLFRPVRELTNFYLNQSLLQKADSVSAAAMDLLKLFPPRSYLDLGISVYWTRAKVEERLFRYEAAEANYLKALSFRWNSLQTEILEDLFQLYLKTGNERGKQKTLKRLTTATTDPFNIQLRLANLYREQGLFQTAEAEYLNLLKQNDATAWKKANVFTQIGYQYQLLGNYDKALSNFKLASDLWFEIEGGKGKSYLATLSWITECYRYFNMNDLVEKSFREEIALSIKLHGEGSEAHSNVLLRKGYFDYYGKRYLQASESMQHLAKLFFNKKITDTRFVSLLILKAQIDLATSNFVEADKNISEASQLLMLQGESADVIQLQINTNVIRGSILEKLTRLEDAEKVYTDNLTRQLQRYNSDLALPVLEARELLSRFYLRSKQFERADVQFEMLFSKYKELAQRNFTFMTGSERSSYFSRLEYQLNVFNAYAKERANKELKWKEKLFESSVFSQSLFLAMHKNFRNFIYQQKDTTLQNEMKRWLDFRTQIFNLQLLTEEERVKANINLNALMAQAELMEKKLIQKSSAFGVFLQISGSGEQIVKNLKHSEAAVSIMQIPKLQIADEGNPQIAGNDYFALVSFLNGRKELIFLGSVETLARTYRYYRNCSVSKVEDNLSYHQLWKKIDEELDKERVTKVFVAADGLLSLINIETLQSERGYVQDYRKIINVNGLRDIPHLIDVNAFSLKDASLTLVSNPDFQSSESLADSLRDASSPIIPDKVSRAFSSNAISPLPGTQAESDQIKLIAEGSGLLVATLTARKSSEQNVKSQSSSILHIATHGYFLSDSLFFGKDVGKSFQMNPLLQSGLLLSGAQQTLQSTQTNPENDGLLTAAEVTSMNLTNTYLTILSACETGIGNLISGEGVYGLRRAIQIAGGRNLIVSLWKVDDQVTAQLMVEFYKNFFSGDDLGESLMKAQKLIRSQHPEVYYWGAFMLVRG